MADPNFRPFVRAVQG